MNKNLRWNLVAAALVAMASSAYATCGQNGEPPCTPQQQLTQLLNNQGQRQGQGQGQSQGQTALSGSDARAVVDNWNAMTTEQRIAFRDSLNPSAQATLDATLTSQSNATIGDISAGSPVTITDNSRMQVFNPVQVAGLPATITVAGIKLTAIDKCGPRWIIKAVKNNFFVAGPFAVWHRKAPFVTEHGTLEGVDEKEPFKTTVLKLPAPFNKEQHVAWGHQLYLVTTEAGLGGGASASGNHASGDRATGGGTSLSSNGAFGAVLYAAVPCKLDQKDVDTTPPKEKVLTGQPAPKKADPLPPINDAMVPTIIVVPATLPELPPMPEITFDKKRFMTDKVVYTGPRKRKDVCPVTQPNGTIKWVPRAADEECGSIRESDHALTGAQGKGIKVQVK